LEICGVDKFVPASEYCERVFDGTHETPKPSATGKPLVTSKHIIGGRLDLQSAYLISDQDHGAIQKRSKVSQWDLLFSMIGTVGEVYLECSLEVPYAVKNVGVFSCGDEIRARWLYYFLRSPYARNHIHRYLNGAVQKFLPLGALRDFPILEYSPDRRGAVEVLSALDAKIDLNNRINVELEALAKIIYDYWFVQFDFPDAHGRPYKSSGGAMVWNETLKREIPEGWATETLWDIATYTNGLAMQKFRPKGDVFLPVIKIKEMSDGFAPDTERASPSIPTKYIVEDGDVLFSWSATLAVQIWTGGRGALNQHIFKVTSEKYPKSYFYFQLLDCLGQFQMMAEKRKTTMGHITLDHLRQAFVVKPPRDLTQQLDHQLRPIFEQYVGLSKQSQRLVELRDWLLPLLMNGQVRVASLPDGVSAPAPEPVAELA